MHIIIVIILYHNDNLFMMAPSFCSKVKEKADIVCIRYLYNLNDQNKEL